MPSKGKTIICSVCGRSGKLCARDMCNACYDRWIKSYKVRRCGNCGEMKPHHSKGLCGKCYHKKVHDTDSFRNRFATYVRERRKQFTELFRQRDRNRHKTETRQRWVHEYQQRNDVKERNRKHVQEYNKQHKEKRDQWGHSRRARIRGLPHDLTTTEWQKILQEHNHCCHYCGKPSSQLQQEHKIPVSRGGGYTKKNIVPACPTCNYRKNDMTDSEFFEYLERYPSREAGG